MAERNSFSRPTSSKGNVKNTNVKASRDQDPRAKAEALMRMNEELEAKTASLFEDVELKNREREEILGSASLLDRVNMDDYLKDWDSHEDNTVLPVDRDLESPTIDSSRPASKVSNISRPPSKAKKSARSQAKKRPVSQPAEEDVSTPDVTFQSTLAKIEDKIDKGESLDYSDDVLPSVATEMGTEAQIRYLKAKLTLTGQDLEKLASDFTKKEQENVTLMGKLKEAEEERNRLSRTNAAQQQQMDKYRKLSDDAKVKADALDTQLAATQKELDQMKRAQKKQESNQGATEVRLNRALEEVEKLKGQLQKAKSDVKETSVGEKKKVDQLLAENKRLEKQKNELLTGFKKQLKLIDVLKRQRKHIEAAKALQFSEEEFVKALDWGN